MKLKKILSKKTDVGSAVEQEEERDAGRMNLQNTRSAMNTVSLRDLAELEKQAQDSIDVTHHDALNPNHTFTTIGSTYTSRDDDAEHQAQTCSLPLCGLLG